MCVYVCVCVWCQVYALSRPTNELEEAEGELDNVDVTVADEEEDKLDEDEGGD